MDANHHHSSSSTSSSSRNHSSSSSLRRNKILLILINFALLAIRNIGGPLIMRLYYLRGGKMIWLNSWLETAGCPFMLIPLIINSFTHRKKISEAGFITIGRTEIMAAAGIGILLGADNYFHTYGVAKLPVSTATLIFTTELGFTALFSFFIVNQKFTPFSINSIVLLMAGAGVLAINTKSDTPATSKKLVFTGKDYVTGFVMCLATAILYALILPLIEITYKKSKVQPITYTFVMEIQFVICFFATGFCTVGALVDRNFQEIANEAAKFELGEKVYYVLLVLTAISWQCFFLGAIGIIFCCSSLLSAIIISCFLPITEILGVIIFHESFNAHKGFSLGLCLWGCFSYFYGEYRSQKNNNNEEEDSNQDSSSTNDRELQVNPSEDNI